MINIPNKIAQLETSLQASQTDKDKIDILCELAALYKDINTEQGIIRIDEAIKLSESLGLIEELAQSYGILGGIYIRQNELNKAIKAHNKQLSLLNAIGKSNQHLNIYNNLGIINMQQGHYKIALQYFYRALSINEENKNKRGIAINYSNIAQVSGLQLNHKEALHFYMKALGMYKEIGNQEQFLGMTYMNIGAEYINMKEYDNALLHYQKSLEVLEELQHTYGINIATHGIGVIFSEKGQFEQALSYFQRSIVLSNELKNNDLVAHNYNRIAVAYSEMKDFKKAIAYNKKCLKIKKHLANATLNNIYSELARNYAAMGKHKKAYKYQHIYIERIERLFNESKGLALAEIRTKYETEKKEREAQEYKLQNATLRLAALRSKMNPHFIFNALTSIQNLILKEAHHDALIYISDFSTMVRKALDTSDKNFIPLQEELDFLKYYVELETLRFKSKFSYEVSVDPKIAANNTYIPSMLIQPYVENAIKHGLWHKKMDGKLRIDLTLNNEQTLTCTISDNGIGRVQAGLFAKKQIHQSKGMKITSQRLELLNTTLEDPVKVNIIDLYDENRVACGTKVAIVIPIEIE